MEPQEPTVAEREPELVRELVEGHAIEGRVLKFVGDKRRWSLLPELIPGNDASGQWFTGVEVLVQTSRSSASQTLRAGTGDRSRLLRGQGGEGPAEICDCFL